MTLSVQRKEIVLNTACLNKLRIAGTLQDSIVDGPGLRYVIFTQGCPHHCEGCHNPDTHDFLAGKDADVDKIISQISNNKMLSGVTFSGGEPMCQAEALVPIAKEVKKMGKHLMIYTGYVYEELLEKPDEGIRQLLELADVLVDGPFVLAKRNLTLIYRGSENQRVIDLNKTRSQGQIVLYHSDYDDLL
ncbi:MAG: anaerobic ribonucleoside-triphosphate reductase activating protein [Lachnospiraceae bacterium]|nr:anaerobic ribonucleoside-triphosphate reductase activating protein [Lachnospiraceae bacterium]